eukprot:Pompholyxophrys_punicea_v1_NODE_671_length_1479_cov_2.714888.p1 type:complete len:200 gc:universal NODE_671_length_1479_cov_2.714888:729-130(-)
MQNITSLTPIVPRASSILIERPHGHRKLHCLPDSYTVVPEVVCKDMLNPPARYYESVANVNIIEDAIKQENKWFDSIKHTLNKTSDEIKHNDYRLTWSSFHSFNDKSMLKRPALIGRLPVFTEKAATHAMVKHGMTIIQSLTNFINPGQIPVMAVDQPLLHWRRKFNGNGLQYLVKTSLSLCLGVCISKCLCFQHWVIY